MAARFDPERLAALPLAGIHRPYPNKIAYVLESDDDVAPPRAVTPAFFGCFDWHSAVHAHWALARLARVAPAGAFVPRARRALATSLTEANIAREREHLAGDPGFERPYGLAWLLTLALELAEWDDAEAHVWADALAPLSELAAGRLADYFRALPFAVRTGEHGQSAFAMGLAFDWATRTRATLPIAEELASVIEAKGRAFHDADRDAPLGREPSGHDFLSPVLGEADLMRRLLPPEAFAAWLSSFLPALAVPDRFSAHLAPVVAPDRTDGKLVHLDGLNLSRACMLEGIASALSEGDARVGVLEQAAARHARAGLEALDAQQYEGTHWLGSFAVYLVTKRGIHGRGR